MFVSYVTNIRFAHMLLHGLRACRRYAIAGIAAPRIAERIFSRAALKISSTSARSQSIPDRRYYAPLKWTGLRSSGNDGGIDSRGKVPRGEKLTAAMTPGGRTNPISEEGGATAARLPFAVSSYLPVKVEFHVSSKMRQADGCDTPCVRWSVYVWCVQRV